MSDTINLRLIDSLYVSQVEYSITGIRTAVPSQQEKPFSECATLYSVPSYHSLYKTGKAIRSFSMPIKGEIKKSLSSMFIWSFGFKFQMTHHST
jgi:hypothetical protein